MSNQLKNQSSPYLLQHADNPVEWYPWGEEAFEKAKQENKPVFLSIGYSTCHWCHMMAHESFENTEIAEILNRYFVAVKVDREERPDIDSVYMSVCQGAYRKRRLAHEYFHDGRTEALLCGHIFSSKEPIRNCGIL